MLPTSLTTIMFAEYLNDPELSDATLVLDVEPTLTIMHGHMFVLYSSAKEYFKTTARYTGAKRKKREEDADETYEPTFRIVGWRDDVRAATDFVEFMYCAFDGPGDSPNTWANDFFSKVDKTRVCSLMCTADAYGARSVA